MSLLLFLFCRSEPLEREREAPGHMTLTRVFFRRVFIYLHLALFKSTRNAVQLSFTSSHVIILAAVTDAVSQSSNHNH